LTTLASRGDDEEKNERRLKDRRGRGRNKSLGNKDMEGEGTKKWAGMFSEKAMGKPT